MFDFIRIQHPDPISEQDLDEMERQYDLQIPSILRDFYFSCNGCDMHPIVYPFNHQLFTVMHFLPVLSGWMSADHILELYTLSGRISRGFWPLATSENGDDFYLDTRKNQVYLLSYDHPDAKVLAAYSIEDFFQRLDRSFALRKDDNNPMKSLLELDYFSDFDQNK